MVVAPLVAVRRQPRLLRWRRLIGAIVIMSDVLQAYV